MPPTDGPPPARSQTISREALERAVRCFAGPDAVLVSARPLAADRGGTELKQAGYGEPLLLVLRAPDGERRAVFRTMMPNWFGHDRRADRAALAILSADTYGDMPRHVQVLDLGALRGSGEVISLGGAGEFYLVTTYAEGTLYAQDLRAIEARGAATLLDAARQHALCQALVELHGARCDAAPEVYTRAVRDLLGGGEGIFGIVDSYPDDGPVPRARLWALERRCLGFRHRLRGKERRLRRTHGDFHPYNVLFREGVDYTLLDASRGGAGDPADDVAAMAINYFFGGVVAPSSWERGLKPLWDGFWKGYLDGTGDEELLEVVAPFLAWRALVLASPVWYPGVSPEGRDAILSFAEAALEAPSFDPGSADRFAGR
jgi:hypothetical protein